MNYTSEVSIRCKPKAYEMLKKTYETNDIMPDKTFQDGDCHILYWGSIVWDEDNDVRVAAMATALKQLDDLFDPSDAKTTDYGYKMFCMDLRQQHFKCGGRCWYNRKETTTMNIETLKEKYLNKEFAIVMNEK